MFGHQGHCRRTGGHPRAPTADRRRRHPRTAPGRSDPPPRFGGGRGARTGSSRAHQHRRRRGIRRSVPAIRETYAHTVAEIRCAIRAMTDAVDLDADANPFLDAGGLEGCLRRTRTTSSHRWPPTRVRLRPSLRNSPGGICAYGASGGGSRRRHRGSVPAAVLRHGHAASCRLDRDDAAKPPAESSMRCVRPTMIVLRGTQAGQSTGAAL